MSVAGAFWQGSESLCVPQSLPVIRNFVQKVSLGVLWCVVVCPCGSGTVTGLCAREQRRAPGCAREGVCDCVIRPHQCVCETLSVCVPVYGSGHVSAYDWVCACAPAPRAFVGHLFLCVAHVTRVYGVGVHTPGKGCLWVCLVPVFVSCVCTCACACAGEACMSVCVSPCSLCL